MATSFVQFSFCKLCKLSHKQKRKKHVYSPRHQTVLKSVLDKFMKKVEAVKSDIASPSVKPLGWEVGAKVWCYFCQLEVLKHQVRPDCVLANAAFLHHLALDSHQVNTDTFLQENLTPLSRKRDFLLSQNELLKFVELAEKAVSDFLERERIKILQETQKIRAAEFHSRIVQSTASQSKVVKADHHHHKIRQNTGVDGSQASGLEGRKTVSAFATGLTCIISTLEDDDRLTPSGNVYTGATPPWLQDDDTQVTDSEIGPTIQVLKKHLSDAKTQKLPPGRVGATANLTSSTTSEQWLPSFGRVWNSGRRLNSKQNFWEKREGRRKDRTEPSPRTTSTSAPAQSTSQSSVSHQTAGPTASVTYVTNSSERQSDNPSTYAADVATDFGQNCDVIADDQRSVIPHSYVRHRNHQPSSTVTSNSGQNSEKVNYQESMPYHPYAQHRHQPSSTVTSNSSQNYEKKNDQQSTLYHPYSRQKQRPQNSEMLADNQQSIPPQAYVRQTQQQSQNSDMLEGNQQSIPPQAYVRQRQQQSQNRDMLGGNQQLSYHPYKRQRQGQHNSEMLMDNQHSVPHHSNTQQPHHSEVVADDIHSVPCRPYVRHRHRSQAVRSDALIPLAVPMNLAKPPVQGQVKQQNL